MSQFKDFLEMLYYVSGTLLIVGLAIGAKQLRLLKKDLDDRNQRSSVEKSVEYLKFYASDFIPEVGKYRDALKKEIAHLEDTSRLFDGNFFFPPTQLTKEEVAETIVKQRLRVISLLNHLEFFSVAILNGLANEDIVYTPLAKNFCKFVEDEHVIISLCRNSGTPYKNLLTLYRKWTDRIEVEKAQLQKEEAEHKIRAKGNSYKGVPPIGMQ